MIIYKYIFNTVFTKSVCDYVCDFLENKSILWGSFNKFPDFFCMGTFIDSTHMKL